MNNKIKFGSGMKLNLGCRVTTMISLLLGNYEIKEPSNQTQYVSFNELTWHLLLHTLFMDLPIYNKYK